MQFEEHIPVILNCHFLNQDGSEATITGIPTITITHYDGTTVITDVNAANMTQLSGSNYYYEWKYATWQTRAYIATYSAIYSGGITAKGSEQFTIVKQRTTGGGIAVASVWSPSEKDKLLKEIDNLKKSLAQSKEVLELRKIVAELQNNIKKILERINDNTYIEEIRKIDLDLLALDKRIDSLEESDKLQGELLVGMADLKSLGKAIIGGDDNGK